MRVAIDEQAEDRHADERKERLHAHQQRRGLRRNVARLDQKLLPERFEREDAAVESDAQRRNQPERSIEPEHFAESDLRGSRRMSQRESPLAADVEHPVKHGTEQAEPAKADAEEKRPAPVG